MILSRKELVTLGVIFSLTRLLLTGVGLLSMTYLTSITGSEYRHLQAHPAVDMWYRWDAGFYIAIARYGYGWASTGQPSADMVFLPLYPMTIRALDDAIGCSSAECGTVSGLVISNLALFGAVLMLYQFTSAYVDKSTAWRSVWLLMLAPSSIYLSGVYAESGFFCLSLLTFVLLCKDQFYAAAAAAGLASLTRPVGIALYISLLFYLWQKARLNSWRKILIAHIPLVTFGVYGLVAGIVTHDIFAYFSAYHTVWGRAVMSSPVQTFLAYFSGEQVSLWGWRLSWLDLFFALFYLCLALLLLHRDRLLGLFALTAIAVPIGSGNLVGIPRYGAVVFPFYLFIARWADTAWKRILVYVLSICLMIAFTARFVLWRWLA